DIASRSWLFAFRGSFRTLIKWRWHYLRVYALSADFDFDHGSHRGLRRRNISQRNILLQERRWRSAGDITNLASAFVENLVSVAGDASIDHFEPNQRFLHALRFRLFEGGAADKVGLLHLAETIQSGLPHIDRVRDFVSVERQTTFKPQRVARTQAAWDSAKFFSHF